MKLFYHILGVIDNIFLIFIQNIFCHKFSDEIYYFLEYLLTKNFFNFILINEGALVAESVDASDLKSDRGQTRCRFKSGPGHF